VKIHSSIQIKGGCPNPTLSLHPLILLTYFPFRVLLDAYIFWFVEMRGLLLIENKIWSSSKIVEAWWSFSSIIIGE